MFFVYLFSIFFGYPLSELGQDNFDLRNKATQKMTDTFPLSLPSLWFGLFSSDPEVKYRCEIILKNKKAENVIIAKKMSNSRIMKIITMDEYPTTKDSDFLENFDNWQDFCDVVFHLKLFDPRTESLSQRNREGTVFIAWARAKAVRYGKDPQVGNGKLPEIIRPGQEPKNRK